jgi:FlaA1/EpsC-like NDP-sugar epimerase
MIFKVLADAFLVNLSFIFAYYLRFKVFVFITPSSAPIFGKYLGILIFITIIWLAVFKLVGLYENKKFTALVDEIAMLFVGVVASTLVLLGLLFLNREFWFSRLLVANAGIIAFLAIGLGRILSFWLVRFLKLKGVKVKNVLILGAGDIGLTLADKMLHDKYLGYSL